MKPIIILPPNTMSAEDIAGLRDNGICVVVSEDPSKVKFVDPIPAISSRTDIENAAIKLSRKILSPNYWTNGAESSAHRAIINTYVECLLKGTPLDKNGTVQEQEQAIFTQEKNAEICRIAREEARAERAAAKAAKAKK